MLVTSHSKLYLLYNSVSEWLSCFIPDSSLKEVKLISICTFTSPQPFTRSLKSSAVKSSNEFFGSTSSRPFLIALSESHKIHVTAISLTEKFHVKSPINSKFSILLAVLFQSFPTWDTISEPKNCTSMLSSRAVPPSIAKPGMLWTNVSPAARAEASALCNWEVQIFCWAMSYKKCLSHLKFTLLPQALIWQFCFKTVIHVYI